MDGRKYDLSSAGRYRTNRKMSISERLYQRILAKDIVSKDGEVLLKKGTLILKDELDVFKKAASENIIDFEREIHLNSITKSEKKNANFIESVLVYTDNNKTGDLDEMTPIIGESANATKSLSLTLVDFVCAMSYTINLSYGIGQYDDVDHLGNKRLRLIGEQLKSKLDDESLTREDLSNIVSNSTISAYKDEMDAISDLNEARQGAIDKIDEEIQKNAELIKSTGFTDYVDAIEGLGDQTNRYYSMQDFADISTIAYQKGIDIDTSSLEAYYESLQKIQTAMTSEDTNKYAKFIEILGNEISKANTDLQNFNQTVEKYNGALGVLGEIYDATLGKIVPMTEEQKEAYKTQQESTEALNKQGQAYELTDEEIQQYAEDMGISIDEAKEQLGIITEQAKSYEDLAKSIGVSTEELQSYAEMLGLTAEQAALLLSEQNSLNSEIDGIQSAYSTLSSAVKEYNEQGGYSIDTLQSLLELDPEYLSMLQFEGEQLTINEEAIRNRVIAWAEEA